MLHDQSNIIQHCLNDHSILYATTFNTVTTIENSVGPLCSQRSILIERCEHSEYTVFSESLGLSKPCFSHA